MGLELAFVDVHGTDYWLQLSLVIHEQKEVGPMHSVSDLSVKVRGLNLRATNMVKYFLPVLCQTKRIWSFMKCFHSLPSSFYKQNQ
jgi:hypothetical protein